METFFIYMYIFFVLVMPEIAFLEVHFSMMEVPWNTYIENDRCFR